MKSWSLYLCSCTENEQFGENLFMIMYTYTLLIVPKYRWEVLTSPELSNKINSE